MGGMSSEALGEISDSVDSSISSSSRGDPGSDASAASVDTGAISDLIAQFVVADRSGLISGHWTIGVSSLSRSGKARGLKSSWSAQTHLSLGSIMVKVPYGIA